ncbi:B(0,+)-type amino acid transporter 1 [Elysia marginata]|uniref:B(0,+)-type amino acid transporter 1 n=1 Tax=Elysia marginata TaxID=1093978 RepID=A0AAV4GL97_9GAST|nr:B(0,+)-type amino acid transporter 1 [Elysia marginata]
MADFHYITYSLTLPLHYDRNLPRANIAGVFFVMVVYLATNMAYFAAMTTTELLQADAVAVVWGDRVLQQASLLIPLAVSISVFGAVNANAFAGGRTMFVAARDGNLPSILSFIHVEKLTPLPTMVFNTLCAITFVYLGEIYSLIDFFSFTGLFYGLTFASLLVFRVTKPDKPRSYKCPIVIPIAMLVISAYLVIAPIIKKPSIGYLYAALFCLGGLIFYFPCVKYKLNVPYKDEITMYTQIALQVVPPTKYTD